ncbi:hypothetical protein HNP38_002262 [Chryseobacterium defluvii]|uniref:Uncharacterized protein n=1 Tax=Chryseobacterium defluvii TaxID=160396 RepID=A0A840KCQ7_9FLAO|nr:hypothetical protein [Chryseobacterium defluvii]MBB4806966.1 hypothetical protein [Chryseobacterium defluvii]
MKKIYVFGNGNLSWEKFHEFYLDLLKDLDLSECEFIMGDFSGTDTMMMEYLKDKSENVTIVHIGERPRYFVNTFRTKAQSWKTLGAFKSDSDRDNYAISNCTHFLAVDFNSDEKRKSGTLKNIEKCLALNKTKL